jgi:hypothetical protein
MTPPDLGTPDEPPAASGYERMQAEDMANEVRILWSEIGIIALLALLVASYLIIA